MDHTIAQGPVGQMAIGGTGQLHHGYWAALLGFTGRCERWVFTLTISGSEITQYRTLGEDCLGTGYYDDGLDQPIPAPDSTFHSYLQGTLPYLYLSTNIKSSMPDSVDWNLSVVNAEDFSISWNPDSLHPCYTLWIDGVDMRSTDHISDMYDQVFLVSAKRMGVSGVQRLADGQTGSRLYAVYPNPFGHMTTIRYDLPEPGPVRVCVYDVTGRLVSVLAEMVAENKGPSFVVWDGRDSRGIRVGSGVYFVRFESSGTVTTERVVILR
jgi:hypothetical protein